MLTNDIVSFEKPGSDVYFMQSVNVTFKFTNNPDKHAERTSKQFSSYKLWNINIFTDLMSLKWFLR